MKNVLCLAISVCVALLSAQVSADIIQTQGGSYVGAGYSRENLIDGDVDSRYASGQSGSDYFISGTPPEFALDLGMRTIDQVLFATSYDTIRNAAYTFTLEFSTDGTTFSGLESFSSGFDIPATGGYETFYPATKTPPMFDSLWRTTLLELEPTE